MVLCALKFIENGPCIKCCYHKIRITTTKGHKETRKCWYAFYFDCGDGIMRVCRYSDSSNCTQLICTVFMSIIIQKTVQKGSNSCIPAMNWVLC